MITQEHINEIADYLKSFEDGTRKHDQKNIHGCGSSHCLAGWKTYEDAIKEGLVVDDFKQISRYDSEWYSSKLLVEFVTDKLNTKEWLPDEMDYAAQVWCLNEDEAELLFDGDLTLQEMKVNLKFIATSHDLKYDY